MAETTRRRKAPERRLVRFDATERWVHWATAFLFIVLILTAVPLYVGSAAAVIGRRDLVRQIHVAAGLALLVPFLGAIASRRRGRALRRDVARLNMWSPDDRRWVRTWGRDPFVRSGKFNGGQKLNAAFVAGAAVAMLMSGVVIRWFGLFPLSWRTGATFVHDLVAAAIVVVVVAHLVYAFSDRQAVRAMTRGWVSRSWARLHAPRWLDELDRLDDVDLSAGPEPREVEGAGRRRAT